MWRLLPVMSDSLLHCGASILLCRVSQETPSRSWGEVPALARPNNKVGMYVSQLLFWFCSLVCEMKVQSELTQGHARQGLVRVSAVQYFPTGRDTERRQPQEPGVAVIHCTGDTAQRTSRPEGKIRLRDSSKGNKSRICAHPMKIIVYSLLRFSQTL